MSLPATVSRPFFGPRGVLARSLPEYEDRPAQQALAQAVGRTLADGGVLLAEAGTGTGKTLAYLLPAVELGKVEDLPDSVDFWREISAASENCIGQSCPDFDPCWVTRMRQQALEADLVIVNHHLLCADLAVKETSYGEVIPAYEHVIL